MLRYIAVIMIVAGITSCNSESKNSFIVSGTIKNTTAKKIYLEETGIGAPKRVIVDSTIIGKDGSYALRANPKEESLYNLYLDTDVYPMLPMVNDVTRITVNADFNDKANPVKVEGSPNTIAMKDFLDKGNERLLKVNVLGRQMDSLVKAKAPDSLKTDINGKGSAMLDEFRGYVSQFVKNSTSPAVAIYSLGAYRLFGMEEYDSLLTGIVAKFPTHKGVALIKKDFDTQVAKQNQQQNQQQQQSPEKWTGKPAPQFTLPDANGKLIALSSFKGKYVLVDFWASWCGPCRGENPNVVVAYNKFKDKNFTILGVSLDQKKESWQEAVKKDGLEWSQVSDLKYWDSSVVPLYGIDGIPYNVLIDPAGKVIAENLRGPALEDKLGEVLK